MIIQKGGIDEKVNILTDFFDCFYLKGQDSLMSPDFNAKVIIELNEPFISAIDRHIKVSKASKNKNIKDFFIILNVGSDINEWQIPKSVYDSIYGFNDFSIVLPMDSLMPVYVLSLILANKKYFTNGWWNLRGNNFYYNYKGLDVIITSNLNLIFKTNGENKYVLFPLKDLPVNGKFNKQYFIETRYSFWNVYLTQIKLKDITSPIWTGKRDEFK